MVQVGDIIKIIVMVGEPQYEGKVGKVEFIDDIGQIYGSCCGYALVFGLDKFEILGSYSNNVNN